jgi:hypothetical protein
MSEPNLTSVQSPLLQDLGDLVIRREEDGTLTVLQADDVILVSAELIRDSDGAGITVDGPLLRFATVPPLVYRVVAQHGPTTVVALREDAAEVPS